MNKWKLGTFYTLNTQYEEVYNKYLKPSAEKFGLSVLLTTIPNEGTWLRNVSKKPKIIKEQLETLEQDECLVFLDSDATIEQYPKLFEDIPEEYDIAYHTLNWQLWYGYIKNTKELLTGTLWMRNNDKVKKLCEDWYKESSKYSLWEQKALEQVIKNHNIKVCDLPLEYCYMISRPGNLEPLIKLDPVILHHQASRQFKRKII